MCCCIFHRTCTCVTDRMSPTLTGLLSLGGGQAVQLGQIDLNCPKIVHFTEWLNLTLSMNFANFLYGSEISEVDLKSKVSRFVAKWGQVVLVLSHDLKSTFSRFGVKWGRISRLG